MRGRGKYKHLNEGERLPRQTKATPINNKKVSFLFVFAVVRYYFKWNGWELI